ncbi:LacI family transcriptional regulator [Paenibacillus sp. FSL P4-0081]|uniref:LacI family DNA-binding transcriptional regulator n=1 Tax=unclassified Paenibacillus TaxID=185978 RepID=UPI0004F66291|nr:LacI family DNA-binding transcriptional regulator [Paenibacillus sp. FSL P4-0081]AIQ31543.1 LacI family transcriptional regulator [Paenibacillus sp. FSL P4-0081]
MKIDDIARLAGVSKAAVSLAMNNKAGVSEKTRRHILEISRANGYTPRTGKTNKIPLKNSSILRFVVCKNVDIITEHYDSLPFFNELIHHLTAYTSEQGHTLIISSIPIQNIKDGILALEDEQPSAGILMLGTNLSAQNIESILSVHQNIVFLDTFFEHIDASFVAINNYLGGYQAGEYLLSLGYQSIGYVESNVRILNFNKRKEGFLAALRKKNIEIEPENIFMMSPMSVVTQERFRNAIQETKQLPTVIFCENDYMAISAIKTFQEFDIKVPNQIAVMGFDNILEAKVISPELTTIHVKKDLMAITALDMLLNKINTQENQYVQLLVNTEVVERKSCRTLEE